MNVTTLAKEMAVARGCSHYNNQLDGDAPGGIQDHIRSKGCTAASGSLDRVSRERLQADLCHNVQVKG